MWKYKHIGRIVFIFSVVALIVSLVPMAQIYGFWLGLLSLIGVLFAFKWLREQNIDDPFIKRARRNSIWAVIFGFIVGILVNAHSCLCYVGPFKDKVQPIKDELNEEIQKRPELKMDEEESEGEDAG